MVYLFNHITLMIILKIVVLWGDKKQKEVPFSVLYTGIFCFHVNIPKIQNKNHKGIKFVSGNWGRCTNYSWWVWLSEHELSKRRVYLLTYNKKPNIAKSRSLNIIRKISFNDIWKWQHAEKLGYELSTLNTMNSAYALVLLFKIYKHWYRDVSITGEELRNLDLCS